MNTLLISLLGVISYNLNYLLVLFLSLWFEIYIFKSKNDIHHSKKILEYIEKENNYVESYIINQGEKKANGLCCSSKFASYIIHNITETPHKVKADYIIYFIGKIPFEIKIQNPTIEIEVDKETKQKKSIQIYVKEHPWYDSQYKLIELPFDYEPYQRQNEVLNSILDNYNNNQNNIGRYLISGKVGSGKSFIAKLLAKKMNTKLTFDIKLDQPGNHINKVYFKENTISRENPLIILLDEWDVMIKNIHSSSIKPQHKWLITQIINKETYTTFLSEQILLYPYVIYIFTMNSTVKEINDLDPCYLRKGRIDIKFNLSSLSSTL